MSCPRAWLALWGVLACQPVGTQKFAADRVPTQVAAAKLVKAIAQVESATAGRGRGRQAETLLRQAIAADPELWEAHYNLGILLAERGQLLPALRHLEIAFRQAGNAEDIAVAVAEVSRRQGKAQRAVVVLGQFVDRFPDAGQARASLIEVLRQAGKSSDAIAHSRQLLRRSPKNPSALVQLALSHLDNGDSDVAALLIEQALKVQPTVALVQRAAGQVALARGDDARAFAHFRRATQLDPDDVAAGLQGGEIYLRSGVFDEAERLFRQVIEVRPASRAGRLGLAAALRGQGAREDKGPWLEAEELLLHLVARDPEDWAASFNLALLYSMNLGRSAEALPLFRQYLDTAPSSHSARKMAEQWVEELAVSGEGQSASALR